MSRPAPFTFYEFFAGGGMARAGLGAGWRCLFANDFDPVKTRAYGDNWGGDDLRPGDVWALRAEDLPGRADLAWASSPCQDFSLAGARAGLTGGRSSAFFGFWRLVEALAAEGRAPRMVVVENVVGLLSCAGGADFTALCAALAGAGYRFGALEADAAAFTPQSRPRVFVIAVRAEAALGGGVTGGGAGPDGPFHSRAVRLAYERLPASLKAAWVWWRAAPPPPHNLSLAQVLEPDAAVAWHRPDVTARLLSQMAPLHQARVAAVQAAVRADGARRVGALYRRTRGGSPMAEARFDGLAGCLRTPRGGSSRQGLLVVEAQGVRSRLIAPREAARLMGLDEAYRLPAGTTAALHVLGDGVCPPLVRALAAQVIEPVLTQARAQAKTQAGAAA